MAAHIEQRWLSEWSTEKSAVPNDLIAKSDDHATFFREFPEAMKRRWATTRAASAVNANNGPLRKRPEDQQPHGITGVAIHNAR
jgi:hypothetical protein